MALSDDLEERIGQRTEKGTLITRSLVDKVKADESGLEIIEDNTQEILDKLDEAIAAALEEIGLTAETYAKLMAPVDTGRLRNSITYALEPDGKSVWIGTNVEYAPYQENGPRAANGGKGFLRPAANDHVEEYKNIFKQHMENA